MNPKAEGVSVLQAHMSEARFLNTILMYVDVQFKELFQKNFFGYCMHCLGWLD